jgi:hypothetical protein
LGPHIKKKRKYKKINNICSKKPKKIITVKKDARTLKKGQILVEDVHKYKD